MDPAGPRAANPRPLDGITVIGLEQAVAAPFATRQLADLGARVIKVERPGTGDFARGYDESVHGQSSYFVWLNRAKESLTLDLKSAEGQAVLGEMLSGADVLVQNLAPGAAARLGLDADDLAARLPRLVVCDISGFGSAGPWSGRKAYDLLIQAETGLMSLTGTPQDMVRVGISVADIAAGMYAFSGVLAALLQRATKGRAQAVRVSLFDALAEWLGSPAHYAAYGGTPPLRTGGEHATIAPYGPYTTADGETVLIAVQNDREWKAFCDVLLEDAALADDARFSRNSARVAHREELNALISARMAVLDGADAAGLLDHAGVAHARINTMEDFAGHPVLTGRDRWRDIGTPGGPVRALLPPIDLAHSEARMGPVPALGEHTSPILRELGRTDDEIARLRADGVI